MKTSKSHTVYPPEWNGRNFNLWIRHIQRQLDKIRNTDLASKIK